jgi:hypothetical protein
MKRSLWVVGLCTGLACYLGATVLCVLRLVGHQQLHPVGWLLLLTNLSIIWLVFRYLDYKTHLNAPVPLRARHRIY